MADEHTRYDDIRAHRPEPGAYDLATARSIVLEAYSHYERHAANPDEMSPADVTADAAVALLSAFEWAKGKGYFPKTMGSKCLMCGAYPAGGLDHYLPKSKYPEYSILALNLIPACNRCNSRKLDFVGSGSAHFFHAYLDRPPEDVSILVAQTKFVDGGVAVDFSINAALPSELYRRANTQFRRLDLGPLYTAEAAEEMDIHFDVFAAEYRSDGSNGLSRWLIDHAANLRAFRGPHWWYPVFWEALGRDPIFCSGGFKKVRN